MNGKLPYSRETFIGAETDKDFRGMLWDMFNHDAYCTEKRKLECAARFVNSEDRIKDLEARKKIDAGVSAGTGILGGFIAMIGKWFFTGS